MITLLGLGEAGRLYAEGLAREGATVRGYDPFVDADADAYVQHAELSEAVGGAHIVISLVGARAARAVAEQAIPHMAEGAVLADFNTSSPADKAELATATAAHGLRFADVAVLAPVPRAGHATPLMASGPGAEGLHDELAPLGVPIESIGGDAGDAASRKLVRSVFMKGLAGVVLEAVAAGQAADAEAWIREQIAAELGPGGHALVERLILGSHAHAERRAHEMTDALSYLDALSTPKWMSIGAHQWLTSLSSDTSQDPATRA